jgi:hypothetical protein
VREAQDEVAQAREQVQLTAAQVKQRVREAEERAYQRGKIDTLAQMSEAPPTAPAEATTRATPAVATQADRRSVNETGPRVPSLKDSKITMRPFSGGELRKGLGAGFKHWSRGIRDEIEMAQQPCGYRWTQKFLISKLGSCLRNEAEDYFNGLRDTWWEIEPTQEYAMEEMDAAFSRSFTSAQVSEWFKSKKVPNTSWHVH